MTLPDLIATYILSQDAPVSLEAIMARAKGRFTDSDMHNAMSYIHKKRVDVKVTVKDDTCWYSKRVVKPKVVEPKRQKTPEEHAELQDIWDNCPFVTDEERECLQARFKDRSDRCHFLCDTPAGYTRTMERKYGPMEWKRMREKEMVV